MPPDRAYVESLLAEIENTVRFLRELGQQPPEQFVSDLRSRYSACFALLTAIEGTANIAAHLIAAESLESPRGMSESFAVLHRAGILASADLVARLSAMARFRNLLVHRYWTIDYGRVYQILNTSLEDLAEFACDVLRHLDDAGQP